MLRPADVVADFSSYRDCQRQVADAFTDRGSWARMSIFNSARSAPVALRGDRDPARYPVRVGARPHVCALALPEDGNELRGRQCRAVQPALRLVAAELSQQLEL